MIKEENELVNIFLRAQAKNEGWIFSDNILAGIKAVLEFSSPPEAAEPVGWIATKAGGKVIHFAKADGWQVEVAQTEPKRETPEVAATSEYENLRQRCLRLANFHPETKGSIGDIWAEVYKTRNLRQPAAEMLVGYLSEFIDRNFSPPQEHKT